MVQTRNVWMLVLVAVLSAAVALIYEGKTSHRDAGVFTLPRPAADFVLKAPDGSEFRLRQHRGEVVLLSFGYTFCPDVCPTTLVELAQVRVNLGEAAQRVRVAFITIDPERDTPERLREYTNAFDPTFVGLTGSREYLTQVQEAYHVVAQKEQVPGTSAAYLITHSAYVYVIDPQGQLQTLFPFGMSVDNMTHAVEQLLEG